jgi:cell division protein FtsI (penicillin-binding protein 3)
VTPRIVDYLEDARGNRYTLQPRVDNLQAVGKKAARQIHDILIEVVKRGTGVKAQYPGLEIGGKTGTAHIAKHGRYVREYHSSFYGFANDKEGHKYTIGVLVIRAKKPYKYFASASAVPTFKRIVHTLVELDYLKPEGGKTEKLEPLVKPEKFWKKRETEEKKCITRSPDEKRKSVKELFKIKKRPKPPSKPKPKTKPKPKKEEKPKKPAANKAAHELFEDLF